MIDHEFTQSVAASRSNMISRERERVLALLGGDDSPADIYVKEAARCLLLAKHEYDRVFVAARRAKEDTHER